MLRTSMLTVALFMAANATSQADEKKQDKPGSNLTSGYRLYSIGLRCGQLSLIGTYSEAHEALEAATALRKKGAASYLISTGSEGKTVPQGRTAVLCRVYIRGCKGGWREERTCSPEKAKELVAQAQKDQKDKKGDRVENEREIVHDFAPKEAFHVYTVPCKRGSQRIEVHATIEEACATAAHCRAQSQECDILTGTLATTRPAGKPSKYLLYGQKKNRQNWEAVGETEESKRNAAIAKLTQTGYEKVEVVHRYSSK